MKLVQVNAYKEVKVQEGWDVVYADWLFRPRFVVQLRGDEVIDVAPAYGLQPRLTLPTGVEIDIEHARVMHGRIVSAPDSITPVLTPEQSTSTDVLVLVVLASTVIGKPYWRSLSNVYLLKNRQSIGVKSHNSPHLTHVVNVNGVVTVANPKVPRKTYNTVGIRRVGKQLQH